MNSNSVNVIVDVIIVAFGIYMFYSANKMKNTNVPPSIMVSADELKQARDAKGFCQAIFKHMLILGGGCVLYGIAGLVYRFFKDSILGNNQALIEAANNAAEEGSKVGEALTKATPDQIIYIVIVGLFLILIGYFVIIMRKLKSKFL